MLYLVITSLLLHLLAFAWAMVLLRRLKDWRLSFVVGALLLVAVLDMSTLLGPEELSGQAITRGDVLMRVGILTVAMLVLLSVYAVGSMIGERERFVQMARQNKERYRRLVDSIGVITWEADVETWRFTFVSERAETILGHPLSAWFEQDFWINHLHPDDRDRVVSYCTASTERGQEHEFEYRMLRPDGTAVWLHDVVSVTMKDGKPWRIHGAMTDITQRKLAESELHATEARYRQLFDLTPQPMWVYDIETLRFLEVNDAAVQHYGYSREEFLQSTIRDIRPAEELPRLMDSLKDPSERHNTSGWRHRRKDGSLIEVEVASDPVIFRQRPARLVLITDVTERRREEAERRRLAAERERLLGQLKLQFDQMPVGCILSDTRGIITDWNPAAEKMFGWSRDEALGRVLLDLLVPDDLHRTVKDVMQRLRTGNETVASANQNRTKDGRLITCEWQNTPVTDEEGRFAGVLCTVQDVTERIGAEEALRRSETRLRRVFNVNVIGIVFWRHDDQITEANEVFLHMLGYTREDVATGSLRWSMLTPPEHAWLDERARMELDATGVCSPYEKEFIRKDGDRVSILMGAGTLDQDDGSGVSFVVDTTALQRARQLFQQSEERYRRLAEHGAMGIWEVTRDGRTVYANPAMCRMLEVEGLEQLRGMDYRGFFTAESTVVMEREQQRRLTGVQSTYEVELVGAQGRRRQVMISGAPVISPGQELETFVGTFTDITDLKRAEEALRQSQKMDAVGQLASGVAHDFNNLITAIFGYTSLARRTLSLNHPATRALDRVDAAARQAAGVTRGLLTFSRQSSSEKRPIQLGKTVLDAVQLLRRMLPTSIELRTKVEGDDDSQWIWADATQIQQVVLNLAINARDAMAEGGRLWITVAAPRPDHGLNGDTGRFISLTVQDEGHGMTPEVQSRLFEPFFTTKPPGQGTGLGLPIIHGIVKDHAGTVQVRSAPGQGAAFTVLLPRCDPPSANPGAEDPQDTATGHGEVILLAESQTYVREIMATMLQSLGYKVVQCADRISLESAVKVWSARARLLILDRDMRCGPVQADGEENHAKLGVLAAGPSGGEIPTILMAANIEDLEEERDTRTILLQKPFQMSELATAVARALTGRQEPTE
jgi:two-component system, cell cycle sensor histidine kinase and response regulator CckA